MNELMHTMQEQIDACDARMIFFVHGWSLQLSSLVKSWMQNRMYTNMIPRPNLGSDFISPQWRLRWGYLKFTSNVLLDHK